MINRILLVLMVALSLYAESNENGIEAKFEKAKQNGVTFRAVGNEPGWILEISSNDVLFLTNLGQDRTHFNVVKTFSEYNTREYEMHSKNNTLHVRIEKRRCQDTMVDRVYASTVYINFDGVNMTGCGKALNGHGQVK